MDMKKKETKKAQSIEHLSELIIVIVCLFLFIFVIFVLNVVLTGVLWGGLSFQSVQETFYGNVSNAQIQAEIVSSWFCSANEFLLELTNYHSHVISGRNCILLKTLYG